MQKSRFIFFKLFSFSFLFFWYFVYLKCFEGSVDITSIRMGYDTNYRIS